MTTTAEVLQIVERYPAEAERVVLRPSGLLASEEGLDEVAREIVALANHQGGRLILGVSESGQFEGELALEHEPLQEAFERLCETRIVPVPELSLELLAGERGRLAVIRVERRAGPPQAVARVLAGGGVTARAFYVRDGVRTRPVSDAHLAWMFRVVGDPAVRVESELDLHLAAGGMALATAVPQPAAVDRFRPLMTQAAGSGVASSEREARAGAINELAAWAFLAELEDAVERADLDTREVALDDLHVPAHGSAYAGDDGGLRGLLDGDRRRRGLAGLLGRKAPGRAFKLPARAEVQVDYLSRQGKGRVTILHPGFVLGLSSRIVGHGPGFGPSLGGAEVAELEWVRLAMVLNASLVWDPRTGEAAERFVRTFARRVRTRWDSDRWRSTLDPAWVEDVVPRSGSPADPSGRS